MARLCVLSSPMDPDLLFSSMRVSERLSRMYEIDIEAVLSLIHISEPTRPY